MEYTFKNTELKNIYERYTRIIKSNPGYIKNHNSFVSDDYYKIPVGYLLTANEISNDKKVNLPLDLTYKTIKNLPAVLAYIYAFGSNGMPDDRVNAVGATLASYLTFLCANEHKTAIQFLPIPGDIRETVFDERYWCGQEMTTGLQYKTDLRPFAIRSMKFLENGNIQILFDRVIRQYKRMTGVDLTEYGLKDIEFDNPLHA